MPNVSVLITQSLRKHWAEYWRDRPLDTPPDLAKTLAEATPVADLTTLDITLSGDGAAWEHPNLPERVFVARVRGSGVWAVVGLFWRNKKRSLRPSRAFTPRHNRVEPEPAGGWPPPPDVGDVPAGVSPSVMRVWLVTASNKMSKWLSNQPHNHPQRAAVQKRYESLTEHLRELRQSKADADRDELAAVVSAVGAEIDGKAQLLPVVRWLIAEVNKLRARVDQLEVVAEEVG